MTVGWMLINVALVAVAIAIVATPTVLIPMRLLRELRTSERTVRPMNAEREHRQPWAADARGHAEAA